jgi:hypothetical protein
MTFPVLIDFSPAPHAGQSPNTNAASCSTPSKDWTLETISSTVLEVVQEVLVGESVGEDTPLMDAGIDSLSAIAFRTTLNKCMGVASIPATILFDYPSIRQINAYLSHSCLAQPPTSGGVPEADTSVGRAHDLNGMAQQVSRGCCAVRVCVIQSTHPARVPSQRCVIGGRPSTGSFRSLHVDECPGKGVRVGKAAALLRHTTSSRHCYCRNAGDHSHGFGMISSGHGLEEHRGHPFGHREHVSRGPMETCTTKCGTLVLLSRLVSSVQKIDRK